MWARLVEDLLAGIEDGRSSVDGASHGDPYEDLDRSGSSDLTDMGPSDYSTDSQGQRRNILVLKGHRHRPGRLCNTVLHVYLRSSTGCSLP